ncbi:hypothetical protein NPIL_481411, partial [Nephila pilipes]
MACRKLQHPDNSVPDQLSHTTLQKHAGIKSERGGRDRIKLFNKWIGNLIACWGAALH